MNDEFRGGVPRIIAQDGYRSLLFLMDQVRSADPQAKLDLPDMPGRSRIERVEFVEFTANEEEAAALRRMLQTLGFSHVAQHIAKKVEVWQQGQIRLVINTEKEGFAHSAYVMHGTSVCDIGFRVDNADATRRRAVAMGSSIFSQRKGKDEIDIPAVRGVGGSVLHFLDQSPAYMDVWTTEFDPVSQESDRSAGLSAIDHIAQIMRADELLTWTLFYTSIFDVVKTPIVDVEDPGGLVRSLALKNSDGTLRLTMNGADTHKTFAGRFMADSFGSLVQHIAFTTEDIFATANALAEHGFEALEVSPNYYLDLAARFGLDEAFTVNLSAHNLLYDRDENGEFFQLYSKPYGNGFFFEVVERRGGYDGYGASNASYRTAALKQYSRPSNIPRT